ncbi:hypothetical protein GOODEAATRI_009574, partial [Goodea atripinnis]
AQTPKKSGIPAPREIPSSITRDQVSLRDRLKSSSSKRIVTSSSTSSISTLAKQTRSSTKTRADVESQERGLLESQVKELLAEAKAKDLEISNLRTELQRCKNKTSPTSSLPSPSSVSHQEHVADHEQGQVAEALVLVRELREKNGRFQRELAALREENQGLKEKLLFLEGSPLSNKKTSSSTITLVNGVPSDHSASQKDTIISTASSLKTSVSSSTDISKESPSPDSSEFEKIPSRSESGSSSVSGEAVTVNSSGGQDVSVRRLTEQIHKMEESHHSTAEELQATLQELADQQQVVQELTAENERLTEEKRLLQTSLQQQRDRLEVLAQQNETLALRIQEQAQAQAQREQELGSQGPRLAELEQRYAELVESSRFEREKLVDIQQQLTGSLRALEEEHQEAQVQVCCLKEELDRLQDQLDKEVESSGQALQAAEEHKATAECLRLENSRFKAQVDIERQKVGELKAMQSTSDSTELQNLLKTAHSERDKLEVELTELRQELLKTQAEAEHVRATVSKVGGVNWRKSLFWEVTEVPTAWLEVFTSEERDEWRRFQADLQTAVVVANDIKVEAQQELRTLRRQLQEEQDRNTKLSADLQAMQGVRISTGTAFDTKTAVEGH